jgi:hypothetical protein
LYNLWTSYGSSVQETGIYRSLCLYVGSVKWYITFGICPFPLDELSPLILDHEPSRQQCQNNLQVPIQWLLTFTQWIQGALTFNEEMIPQSTYKNQIKINYENQFLINYIKNLN